ncbi:MAG TPA: alpha/beta hydrolase [Oligoflexus sp.]|uniref:alpha/beta fold hydrolase n=1 Tax=Oligoflexus sp. TaxID=1971216 RepID=UPI002D800F2E|nr:alpha/beta hydrolase [Oligoflexus sp.]HET9236655.1 alpha/beta hydrolase [Oligoflexus sp.]
MQAFVASRDGVEIFYELSGQGTEALVFVHGWLGQGSWWEAQRKVFEAHYRVVQMDLAGHGRSGKDRKTWSVASFADDIAAVVQHAGLNACHLIGHSMSGSNVIAAAQLLGSRVHSIILVDTLLDLDDMPSLEAVQPLFAGLKTDYQATMDHAFAQFLLVPASPAAVRERLQNEMGAADPALAVAVLEPFYRTDIRPQAAALQLPVRAINADMRPTNATVNRKYFKNFDFKVLAGVGHYPMLEKPEEFNTLLQETLRELHE